MSKAASLLPALLLAAPLAAGPAAAQEGNIAVRAGKVITEPGTVIENGTVIVQNGRIVAVGGPDLEVPFDTMLREFPEGVLFAGFTEAHTSNGMDRANENVPVAPFLNVADSIDPVSFFFEDELRGGVTALGVIPGNNCVIGGQGAIISPVGRTVEEMAMNANMGMKIAIGPKWGWSRSTQLAELREAKSKLDDSLRRLGQKLLDDQADEADAKKAGEEADEKKDDHDNLDRAGGFIRFGDDFPGKDLISEEDLNDVDRGLCEIFNNNVRIWLSCPDATDVVHGLRWLNEHNLIHNTVFVIEAGAHKVAETLAKTGRPVVLTGGLFHIEVDPVTRKEKRTFVPKVFSDLGVDLAIGSEKGRMGPDRLAYQAATCVREGVSPAIALSMVTRNAAEAWGMEGKIGVLKEGAVGNMVVMSGAPLSLQSKVLKVWIGGKEAYDRENDERLQRLLEGAE